MIYEYQRRLSHYLRTSKYVPDDGNKQSRAAQATARRVETYAGLRVCRRGSLLCLIRVGSLIRPDSTDSVV